MLVITEFALSLVLMIAAGLLLRSFWDLLNVRLGFNPQNVMAVRTRLPYPNDPKTDIYATPAQEAPFLREVLRRSKTLPGVEEVALGDTASIPLDQSLRESESDLRGPLLLDTRGARQSERPACGRSSGQALRQTIFTCWESRCSAAACSTNWITTTLRKSR